MKYIVFLISLGISTIAAAQIEIGKQETKIVLYSGEIIQGISLDYVFQPSEDAKFTLDGETYLSSEVKFFQNGHGYFANLGKLHGDNSERYALRIRKGKMNLYEEIEMEVYGGDEIKTTNESVAQDPLLATGESFQYYNIGDESVREATYSNLKVDLKDNEESMRHLNKYRRYKWLQMALITAGAGVIAYDVASKSGAGIKFNPFMAFGVVLGGSSYFLQTPKSDELWFAADAYNTVTAPVDESHTATP